MQIKLKKVWIEKHLDIKIGDLILIPRFCGTVCGGDDVGELGRRSTIGELS